MWNKVGSQPKIDEIEVTVMGPGHGEAVVIHVGGGKWMIVDSCIDREDDARKSAPLLYLNALGINVEEAVELIVVSHWDDDHVRGISQLVDECHAAIFSCPKCLTKREFGRYVERLSTGARTTRGANVSEFRSALDILADRGQVVRGAFSGRQLLAQPIVRAWSPSDREYDLFMNFIALDTPKHSQGHRKAIPGSPNLTSTVITIEWPDISVLLGGDMETHKTDNNRGWVAAINEATRLKTPKADLVKIPHHGSHTGHHERMWTDLLQEKPIAVIAPYGRGVIDKRPPKSSDVRRIRKLSRSLYQTARHTISGKKLTPAIRTALDAGKIRLSSDTPSIGLARFRRSPGQNWTSDKLGDAFRHS